MQNTPEEWLEWLEDRLTQKPPCGNSCYPEHRKNLANSIFERAKNLEEFKMGHLCDTCNSGESDGRPGSDCSTSTDDITIEKQNVTQCGTYKELPNGQRNITQEWLDGEEE